MEICRYPNDNFGSFARYYKIWVEGVDTAYERKPLESETQREILRNTFEEIKAKKIMKLDKKAYKDAKLCP